MIAIPSGFSPEEYLALEREHSIRHEYRRGLVYAMAGGSDDHSRLSINLLTEFNLFLRDGDCQFFSGDVKVNYAQDFYYYPDAFVTCDARDREDKYVKRRPKLIAEVLSPSTEKFDREEKFEDYKALTSLEEYVVISQDRMQVECFRVSPQKHWEMEAYGRGDQVIFQSIGLAVAIEDLYRGITGLGSGAI
jgi:Uma2 family endonuclease